MQNVIITTNDNENLIWQGITSNKVFSNLVKYKNLGGFLRYNIEVLAEVPKQKNNHKTLVIFLAQKVFFSPNLDLVNEFFINQPNWNN